MNNVPVLEFGTEPHTRRVKMDKEETTYHMQPVLQYNLRYNENYGW